MATPDCGSFWPKFRNPNSKIRIRLAPSRLNSDNQCRIDLGFIHPFEDGILLRKEVIQPQVPLRLPCYDFTPITDRTLGTCLPRVGPATSGTIDFRGVTGGVYKARERIHRGMLIHDY